jgi:hypothetical protein
MQDNPYDPPKVPAETPKGSMEPFLAPIARPMCLWGWGIAACSAVPFYALLLYGERIAIPFLGLGHKRGEAVLEVVLTGLYFLAIAGMIAGVVGAFGWAVSRSRK